MNTPRQATSGELDDYSPKASDILNSSDLPGTYLSETLVEVIPRCDVTSAWNCAAPLIVVLEPAGHAPGIYALSPGTTVIAVGTGGQFSIVYGGASDGQSYTLNVANVSVTSTAFAVGSTTQRALPSDGSVALTMTLTPLGVTGSPLVNVRASSRRVGRAT